ncbi:hypothetical protein ACFL9U_10980 [Thermodesulfobacteriota bacterium]
MTFKDNLLEKIEIEKLTKTIVHSIGPPESGRKVDKESMRRLLGMGAFEYRRERDLDLYVFSEKPQKGKILVLDNELAIYNTTIEDVALRKSPTIREMISIRNAIKILSDSDVVESKKEESVQAVREQCLGPLDLSFTTSDLDEIVHDGVASLERGYTEGIVECLSLFSEILGYQPPPKHFRVGNHEIIGAATQKEGGELLFGPMVIYGIIHNILRLFDEQVGSFDKAKIERMHQVARGKEAPSLEGPEVFHHLKQTVIERNIWVLSDE